MAFFTTASTTSVNTRLTTFSLDRSDLLPPSTTFLDIGTRFHTTFTATTPFFYMNSLFTPPTECWDRPFTAFCFQRCYGELDEIMWDYEFGDDKTLGCSHPEWISSGRWFHQSTTYGSGAMALTMTGVCPIGYDTVGTRVPTSLGGETYYYDQPEGRYMEVPVTEAFCCPTGFTAKNFADGDVFGCESRVETPTTVSILYPIKGSGTEKSTGTSIRSVTSMDVYDRGYVVRWNELQLPYFTPASAPLLNSNGKSIYSYPQTITTTQEPVEIPTDIEIGGSGGDDGAGSSGLSAPSLPRKVVGAIVGSVVGGVLAGVAIIWTCIRKRRKDTKMSSASPEEQVSGSGNMQQTVHGQPQTLGPSRHGA
ncbi:hypothetical protein ACJZ2D_016257 [Fusarium nematophilum]